VQHTPAATTNEKEFELKSGTGEILTFICNDKRERDNWVKVHNRTHHTAHYPFLALLPYLSGVDAISSFFRQKDCADSEGLIKKWATIYSQHGVKPFCL